MNKVPVKKLARDLGMPMTRLIHQLNEAGIKVSSEDDTVTGQQQLQLIKQLKTVKKNEKNKSNITLDDIKNACELRELNELLTKVMAKQQIQALIKGDNLDLVADSILELARESNPEKELLAAAMLSRLAAVSRNRKPIVFDRVSELFTDEPASIDTLADGDEKTYAASILRHTNETWLSDYSLREAILIDKADNARKELLTASLEREGTIAKWLNVITEQADQLKTVENPETRLRRVKRIFGAMREVVDHWRGDVGANIGENLTKFMRSFLKGKLSNLDQQVLYNGLDDLLLILSRVIELRFSTALEPTTFSVVGQGKKMLGPGPWANFIRQSSVIPDLRVALLETALVLARQKREVQDIMDVLVACYTSRPQVSAALKRHFAVAHGELTREVEAWWCSGGEQIRGRSNKVRKIGNTEDKQIGSLLIEVEYSREIMEKLKRAVVPFLEITDPVLAKTVNRAASDYTKMAQIARRLARMRKLSKTELKGERLEYNRQEHEMRGGHRSGVRKVKVVRDGILKEFRGYKKTLVKPWVEPDE